MLNRLRSAFGYAAAETTNKRKAPNGRTKHEDHVLTGAKRRKLTGGTRELVRNFSLVSWAIRAHLDYVSSFTFQMRSDNEELNNQVEQLMKTHSRPANCDAAGRHPLPKMIRLFEARRTIDGDVFGLKLSDGRIQAIEGDRIADPVGQPLDNWVNGVKINNRGRAVAYGLNNRTRGGSLEWSRSIRAGNVIQHGFFERFDQVRGISPLASAINSFQDIYTGIDLALAKMKVEQLFALTFYRDADEAAGDLSGGLDSEGDEDRSSYSVDFGKGPVLLDLDPGDRAEFLKSDNPGKSTQEFLQIVMDLAIKCLDLPPNFADPSKTNFFGSRASWLQYDRSCQAKRADLLELLRKITVWLLGLWIMDGRLRLPAGMTLSDVEFEWVPKGMPWFDPGKELKGVVTAIKAGLDNPYRAAKEADRGEFEDNIDQIAKAKAYAASKGVDLEFVVPPSEPMETDDEWIVEKPA